MSIKWWLPLALVLTACPSPEDGEGEAQAGPGNAAGQGGGPGGGPGGGAAGGPGGGVGGLGGVFVILSNPMNGFTQRQTKKRNDLTHSFSVMVKNSQSWFLVLIHNHVKKN